MCSGLQSTTSCGSNNSAIQSIASQSALSVDATLVDRKREHWKHPMWWHMLSRPEQLAKIAAADKAVDLLWFVHGLSFNLIGSRLFCDAVEKIKAAPGYKPCHRTTLSTSHLAARNAEANEFKIKRLQHGKQYGFLRTQQQTQADLALPKCIQRTNGSSLVQIQMKSCSIYKILLTSEQLLQPYYMR